MTSDLFEQNGTKGGRCAFYYLKQLVILILLLISTLLYATTASAKKTDNQPEKLALANTHYSSNEILRQALPKSVKKLLKKYKIPEKNLSVYIRDLNAKSAMMSHNINTPRTPASTMKLLTSYAALKKLGPNYSWRTEVWFRGDFENDTLNGDIILKGYGDPFLVYENFWKIVKTLRDKGLKHINGNVVIDNSYFKLPSHDSAAFDGKEFRVYNAPSSALMFNFQASRFLFKPILTATTQKKKGKKKKQSLGKVSITPLPTIKNFTFINDVKLTRGRCRKSHYRPKFSRDKNNILTIKGKYAAKCKQKFILRAISTPEEHVFNAFRDFWTDLNGTLTGVLKIGKINAEDKRFHVYSSPTLAEQIRLINKWSNNVMTKQLLLTLGSKMFGAPATLEKGQRAVLEVLSENKINTDGIQLENGSGLSRISRITAKQMGALLETAYRDAYMPEFMSSLSLSGVDGTLVNRFRKGDLRGRSHFKTGTLDFVSAISGYMLNRNGKRLVIVIQHNGKRTGGGRARKIQDALLLWSFEQ